METISLSLKSFYLLAQILNWVFARLDKVEQGKATLALLNAQQDAADTQAVQVSTAIGQAVRDHLMGNPGDILTPDPDMLP